MEEEMSKGTTSHCPSSRGRYPWLLYSHGEGYTDHTFCSLPSPLSKYVAASCPISKLQGKKVLSSCHGWLILYSNTDRANVHVYSLWNPVTLESIHIPPLEWNQNKRIDDLVLSSPPSNPDSVLVLFMEAEFESSSLSILFCGLHDTKWTEMQYGRSEKTDCFFSAVSYNGKIYAATMYGKLVLIEMVKPNYELTIRLLDCQIPLPCQPFSNLSVNYLVESCGELFVIFFTFEGINREGIIAIDVLKLDFSTMIWERVKSAKDRVFFLSLGMNLTISCSALGSSTEGGGGYIHFTGLLGDKSFYSYNIEDKSIYLSFPCPDLPSPCRPCFWVMPESSRLSDDGEAAKHKNDKEGLEGKIEELIEVMREKGCNIDGRKNMTECHMFSLPSDILKLIAELSTFLVDYLNFRVTCKLIRSAVPPIKLRSASAPKLRQTRSLSPWLILSDKDKGVMTFIDSKLGGRYFMSIPELLGEAIICASKCGWLLMRTDKSSMVFFNPFTNAIVQLPELHRMQILSFSFSFPPTSSDCLVIGISVPCGPTIDVHFTRPGKSEWDCIEFDIQFLPYHNSPIFFDMQFYFLGRDGKLGMFGFEEEEGSCVWDVLDGLKPPCNSFHQTFLVDCGADFLVSVFVGEFGKWVQVFKLNHHTWDWEKVESLGNRMIFISGSASFSAVAGIPGMENKIYFPRLCDQNIIFYSLDTCKYHTFGSQEPLMDFYDTSEPLLCGWIEPRWSGDH